MKTKKIITGLSLLPMLAGAVLTSCITDEALLPGGPSTGTGDEATVTFSLSLPGISAPATRAGMSENDESSVETVDILLFRKDEGGDRLYWNKVTGVSIDNSPGNTKSFTAVIPVKDYNNYDITVIANGRAQVVAAGLVRGEAKQAALDKLISDVSGEASHKWSGAIPMWGEAVNITVSASTNLSGANAVKMTRMVARIDVGLSKLAASGSETGTGNANFALGSVRLYNYSTRGTLAPDLNAGWSVGNSTNPPKATAPHQPAGTGGYGRMLYDEHQPLTYTASDQHSSADLMPDSLVRAIYTFEAPAGSTTTPDTNICLVIGGKYKNGTETFYRIDFVVKNGITQTYDYLALLRNHQYVVNITKVTGDGYGTPDEAFHSEPINIEAGILEWDRSEFEHIVFNAQDYIAADHTEFLFAGEAGSDVLTVNTDISNWTARVCDENGDPLPASDRWLKVNGLDQMSSTTAGADVPLTISVTENPNTTDERTAYILIEGARLVFKVEVTQEPADITPLAAPGVIGYVWAPGDATNHLRLTLNGDKVYNQTPFVAAVNGPSLATGQPVEQFRVYVAYFKFGSVVAIGSRDNGTFNAVNDVIAAPNEFQGGARQGSGPAIGYIGTTWDKILTPTGLTAGKDIREATNVGNGNAIGDPCEYYIDEFGSGWRLPSAGTASPYSWHKDGGSPFGTSSISAIDWTLPNGAKWQAAGGAGAGIPAGAVGGDGTTADWSMFLPAAGIRNMYGAVGGQGSFGYYWSSTASNSGTNGYGLGLSFANLLPAFNAIYSSSFAVRCVRTVAP